MNNEGTIIINGQKSASLPIKGHDQAENGVFAHLFAAEAVAAYGARLTDYTNDASASRGPDKIVRI